MTATDLLKSSSVAIVGIALAPVITIVGILLIAWLLVRPVLLLGTALVATILVVIASIAWWSLPAVDGTDVVPGLSAPAQVVRDRDGVPHIFAGNPMDAFRALGYVHAQDRFFQMEFARRLIAGRLSEVIGAGGLPSDRFMRTLGLGRLAEARLQGMESWTREALDAYAGGVNAWLNSPSAVLPPDLLLLGVEPEPWRPADSMLWAEAMALLLSGNWREELLRARLTDAVPELMPVLFPEEPKDGPATLAGAWRGLPLERFAEVLPPVFAAASASNAWAVGGARTATGRPLLANDPHLGFSAPGMWYLARVEAPGLQMTGATIPGQPFVVLGHNDDVAWGFTTTHADTQDLFIERIDGADNGRYLTPDGSAAFETREETIRVRFRSEPELLRVRRTRHGPVVSDLGDAVVPRPAPDRVVSLAWTGLAPDDRTADAFARLVRARGAAEVRAAADLFGAPVQNLLYADTTGTIGFRVVGRIPRRLAGDGTVPVDGSSGANDWNGTIPSSDLPATENPPAGQLVNANNRVTAGPDAAALAATWPEGFRAARIEERLGGRSGLTADDMMALQLDDHAGEVALLRPRLLELARRATPATTARDELLAIVAAWDGRMDRHAVAPTVWTAWFDALQERLFRPRLEALYDAWGRRRQPRSVAAALADGDRWCAAGDCAAVVAGTLDDARARLADLLGADTAGWQWGKLHRARFTHPVAQRLAALAGLLSTSVATDGGDFTVNRGTAANADARRPFAHVHGPGLRAVYDLAALDRSVFAMAPGQSAHPLSRHWSDLAERWAEGGHRRLDLSAEELADATTGTLVLNPAE
ncbi:MAG: penicillin acylase family protein [Alphaproteobacteria bacterium]